MENQNMKKLIVNGVELHVYKNGKIWKPSQIINSRKTQGRWVHGGAMNAGYERFRCGDRMIKVHQIVAQAWLAPKSDGEVVDHINGDRSDNDSTNLRYISSRQNARGFRHKKSGATSKFRGVSFCRNMEKWLVQVTRHNKSPNCGYFDNEIDAAKHYDRIALDDGYSVEATNAYNFGI